MLRRFTIALALVILGLGMNTAQAQDNEPMEVTVRQINQIRATALDSLQTMASTLTQAEIQTLATPVLAGERVTFTAFIMTDVRKSGLATYRPSNTPPIGRVHVYVRDTSAISQGKAGMDIQVVDGDFESTGILQTLPGDVVEIDAVVSPFFGEGGVSMQLAPISIVPTGETFETFGLTEDILAPVTVTTADINTNVGDGLMTINWENYEALNGQYVRVEGARVIQRDLGIDDERPDFDISSDNGTTRVPMYDTSLRYRNDRNGEYYSDFDVRANDDDYVPPPPGAVVDMQGFLIFQGDDPFGTAAVQEVQFLITPFEDADVTVIESPPVTTLPTTPDFVAGAEPVTVSFEASADANAGRTLDTVELKYYTSVSTDTLTLQPTTVDGDTYSFVIPVVADGAFVTYWGVATDNTGAESRTQDVSYRSLVDGIDEIADIQETLDGGPGRSPFVDVTTAMDITAMVVSNPELSGFIVLQDDAELGAWSGIIVRGSDATDVLKQGDIINITEATIEERFDVTQLRDLTFTVESSGNELYGYKTVTTDVLQDASIAEAHEGMMLRFEGATITSIDSFGEWSFSTDGTEDNEVSADDASDAIANDYNETVLAAGEVRDFQGIWWYSFGAYKLVPEVEADISAVINVSNEGDGELPNRVALAQNYPNPFNPVTTISYDVPATALVKLSVYDLLGREVAVLVDRTVTAGSHTVSFDASNLASGLYLYRLETGSKTLVKTMTVLK